MGHALSDLIAERIDGRAGSPATWCAQKRGADHLRNFDRPSNATEPRRRSHSVAPHDGVSPAMVTLPSRANVVGFSMQTRTSRAVSRLKGGCARRAPKTPPDGSHLPNCYTSQRGRVGFLRRSGRRLDETILPIRAKQHALPVAAESSAGAQQFFSSLLSSAHVVRAW